MYSYGKTQYEKMLLKIQCIEWLDVKKNCYEISEKLFRYFFYN